MKLYKRILVYGLAFGVYPFIIAFFVAREIALNPPKDNLLIKTNCMLPAKIKDKFINTIERKDVKYIKVKPDSDSKIKIIPKDIGQIVISINEKESDPITYCNSKFSPILELFLIEDVNLESDKQLNKTGEYDSKEVLIEMKNTQTLLLKIR
jgi:hypothetical protein